MADPIPFPQPITAPATPTSTIQDGATEIAAFEKILGDPNAEVMREALLALEWDAFERFVRYVFECAGYSVEHVGSDHKRHHVDLRLYEGTIARGRPAALVEVRHYRSALLKHQAVAAFVGNLTLAGAKRGYLITTGQFTGPARDAAQQATQRGISACLIDWRHLARYIAYLQDSRREEQDGRWRAPAPTPPDWLLVADALPRREPRQTTILAIANNKGGVAKTTTALNLGVALAARGERVLLVDLDGQASLSRLLPLPDPRRRPPRDAPPPAREKFVSDYFSGKASLAALIQPTGFPFLWLIPARRDLYARDPGGAAHPEDEIAFAQAVHSPELAIQTGVHGAGVFDWIIFDTPPAQSGYTRAALAASHYILIPAAVEAVAQESALGIYRTTRAMAGLMGRGVHVVGSAITRWDGKSQAMKSEMETLKSQLGALGANVLGTIPHDANIATVHFQTAKGQVKSIFGFQQSKAASAYLALLDALTKEMAPHVHQRPK